MSTQWSDKLELWIRHHSILASLVVFVCSLAPRLALTIIAEPQDLLTPDSYTYFAPAQSLLKDWTFLDSHKNPEVSRTPGYPLFLAGIAFLVESELDVQKLRNILIAQTAVLSCSVLFLYWLARRALPPLMAFTGAVLAAFSPWGVALSGRAMTEGLFCFLLVLIFLLIKLVQEVRNMPRAVWGGALIGLLTAFSVFVRPMWPMLFLIAGALFAQYGPRRKGVWLILTAMLVSAAVPLLLWNARNVRQANFNGLSDISGKTTLWCLVARVKALKSGEDRFAVQQASELEEDTWQLSVHEADQERWRRIKEIIWAQPALTVYSFALSAAEHLAHPSPDLLTPAKLNFNGDYWTLAFIWGAFVLLAYAGWRFVFQDDQKHAAIDRRLLSTLLAVCLLLTIATGVSFGAGARYRAPLELIVPLFAGIGLVRFIHSTQRIEFHRPTTRLRRISEQSVRATPADKP
jgi:4-amino-4-deoxy-L-arabinose transferase-like glycosyltransferase